jgi:hypothetical protein
VTFYCMNLATALFAAASPRVLKLPSSSFLHPRVMSLLSVLRRWASTAFVTHSLLRLRNPLLLRWKCEFTSACMLVVILFTICAFTEEI